MREFVNAKIEDPPSPFRAKVRQDGGIYFMPSFSLRSKSYGRTRELSVPRGRRQEIRNA